MDEENIDNLFDQRVNFPDPEALRRFDNLVGIDEIKLRLIRSLGILVNPEGVRQWGKKFHPESTALIELVERRPPLVILSGDVGTGKTELATTAGDPVARQESIDITLFPLSLSTRGSGRVGEMTKLLSEAFNETFKTAEKFKSRGSKARGAVILLVDEADAIVQSRENNQMHHEDRAGVNAFIRGVDRLATQRLPVAVILCTNRLSAIDPAVQRRAAEIFVFNRPNPAQRRTVLQKPLTEIGFTKKEVEKIVQLTGSVDGRKHGFTYSDLTQRLLPALVLDAYPDNQITFKRSLEVLATINPTAPFQKSA
ncbi:MAG: ATP-binding protein [bacterium]|nr:ATP-binding protein [bacterium]